MKRTVATRGSALALWQTEWVIQRLKEAHGAGLTIEILPVRTQGDRVQHVPIAEIGGKGIFVKEIEQAILSGVADFGVHSLKDMPAELPPGLCLAAIPVREDPRDALVLPESGVGGWGLGVGGELPEPPTPNVQRLTPNTQPLAAIPHGASVGTTSRRRGAQLLHERPDLRIEMLRGNLDTRLRKLDTGQHDAVILAAAGLRRLGFSHRISQLLPVEHFVPCAGQGALAVEARSDDRPVLEWLASLEDAASRLCVTAERETLRRFGASCYTPLGAHAVLDGDELRLYGMLASPDGADLVRIETHAPADDPVAAGRRLADRLIEAGGDRVLASLATSDE